MSDDRATVRRFLAGHRAAEQRQRELLALRGARPAQAVAECLEVFAIMDRNGAPPGAPDPVREREVLRVRRLWMKVKREYRSGAKG